MTGSMNGEQYLTVLKEVMLLSVRIVYPEGLYFVHHNCAVHRPDGDDDDGAFEPCRGYYPFTNYYEIAHLISKFDTNEAVIEFKHMDMDTWISRPLDNFTYTIRMKQKFHTHSLMSQEEKITKDHSEYGEIYEAFTRIQWAIDKSYIKIRSGYAVPQKLSLQEFPYTQSAVKRALLILLILVLVFVSCWLSNLVLFIHVLTRMMTDRATGIQELIKLNGVSGITLGVSYFVSSLPPALVFAVGSTWLLKRGAPSIIEHTNGVIIFIALALYTVSIIACAMALSYLAHSTEYAMLIAVFAYTATVIAQKNIMDLVNKNPNRALVLVSGLLPHVPLHWIMYQISMFEVDEKPLTFGDITETVDDSQGSVLDGYFLLSLQTLLFFILTWYMSHARQGKYGNSKPWYFCCMAGFWTNKEVLYKRPYTEEYIERDEKYFEKPPQNMDVGIRVVNVSKYYPKNTALDNVSLDVYKGEITVLIGHNGAGKTTLMSIITGMIPASKGLVYVNGVNSRSHGLKIRKEIGLCPQHNLFLPNLNVLEQVMFFHLLKTKSSFREARTNSKALLDRLGIGHRIYSNPSELSGGMKRRLQLACALTGGSDVLVLDEPTSGLDVETRRELWDLLLSLRGGHTVLLSTHFMEEADALGDRVAALHSGQLKCHATPMYLKRVMGTGYRLTITTVGAPNERNLSSVITEHVRDATVIEKTSNSITYNLPSYATSKFPELFLVLEKSSRKHTKYTNHKKDVLGINTMGLRVTTLETAFLKLCSDTEFVTEDEVEYTDKAPERDLLFGRKLYARQIQALLRRHVNFIREMKLMFILFKIVVPGVLMYWLSKGSHDAEQQPSTEPDLLVDLDMYHSLPERRVLLTMDSSEKASRRVMDKYGNVRFSASKNIKEDLIKIGVNIRDYNKYLVGLELDNENAKALYTTVYRHAAPVAVNLLSNVIASQYLAPSEGGDRLITVHNHPLDEVQPAQGQPAHVKSIVNCCTWAAIVCCIIQITSVNYLTLPAREGASGSRHLHVMAGCPAALHWLCTLAFHTALTTLIMVPLVIFCATFIDKENTLGQPALLLTLTVIIVLGVIAFFGLLYVLVLILAARVADLLGTFLVIIFGFIAPLTTLGVDIMKQDINLILGYILKLTNILIPAQTMTTAAGLAVYVARLNALCEANKANCPDFVVEDTPGFNTDKCCAGVSSPYLAFKEFSPGKEILIIIAQGIVYMILVVMIQKGYFGCLFEKVRNVRFKKDLSSSQDEFVLNEEDYVASEIQMTNSGMENDNDAMLVYDLHKNFPGLSKKKDVYAVRGISLAVKRGECFGLLGTNGAGKSTTFKMLTAEICPTRGTIFANRYFLHKNKKEYMKTIGYCPQFLGIDDFQTGRENLRTLLIIRGFRNKDIDMEISEWINVTGLQKYANTVASKYSGGYMRRLATAAALCSGAPLSLLDEPTAGVDVGARRRVHAALRKCLQQHRSIVITSHSMDEMESMCSRIAIMVRGKIRALGSPAELRFNHARGFAVIFKVTSYLTESEYSNQDRVEDLKITMERKFVCQLKDQHMTMLHYHLDDDILYSELFLKLERIRMTFSDLIEDYSVSETTLEEVFLYLANEDREDQKTGKV